MTSHASHVAWQLIGATAVVVDLSSGSSLAFNEAGTFIWSCLSEKTESEIVLELTKRYGVAAEQAETDVREFLESLRTRKLIL